MAARNINILDLPSEIIELVLQYSTYDEIAGYRLVCRQFNETSKQLLTQGFTRVDRLHAQVQKEVKAKLPRRESERRNHPLAKHVNVLSSVETRLSLLSMTFVKYIDMNLCCFIPGKVLDELFRVLHAVSKPDLQPRAHELLQELRDISSMAMEHFDEKIVPRLKAQMPATPSSPFGTSPGGCSPSVDCARCVLSTPSPVRPPAIRQEMMQIRVSLRSNSASISNLKREVTSWRTRTEADRATGLEQGKRLVELGRGLAELQKQVNSQEAALTDLNRRVDDQDQKMLELMQDVAQLKELRGPLGEDKLYTEGGEEDRDDERKSRKRKIIPQASCSKRAKTTD